MVLLAPPDVGCGGRSRISRHHAELPRVQALGPAPRASGGFLGRPRRQHACHPRRLLCRSVPKAFLASKYFGTMQPYEFALRHLNCTCGVVCLGIPFSPAPMSFGTMLKGFYGNSAMEVVTDKMNERGHIFYCPLLFTQL